ncbi:MAG TPA: hypothetical protein VH142_19390 [Polyangiaceae bacterium]|jgi:hypothetical protein|nr:hypothetical protein [Polyangiaceae bacterium]
MDPSAHFTTLEGTDLSANRGLATKVLVAHLDYESKRRVRVRLVHVVAVLSAPIGAQVAFPGILSPAVGRAAFASWLAAVAWALVAMGAEWRTGKGQEQQWRALRSRRIGDDGEAT